MTTNIPPWLSENINNLTPQQYAFVMSDNKMASYVAGNGFGKTHAGIMRCLRLAYAHPGTIILLCDATTEGAARYLHEATFYFLPAGDVAMNSQARHEIRLVNGSRLLFHYLLYGRRLNDMTRGVVCDAIYLDNNEYLSYRDFISLFLSTRRRSNHDIWSPICYTGEVEWRSWRDLTPKEAIPVPMLEAGQYAESDFVVVDAEDD